jgi:uncharacterized protein YndB with AHSA1/START domain
MRTESRSIAIAAPPEAVFAYVADPRNLPAWAPAFATAVRPDGDDWLVTQGDAELRVAVRTSAEHGTVDLLSTQDARRGAFTRVVPSHEGSAYVFTLHFEDDTPETAVARQMATVEEELRAVRAAVG